ncbi:hypothetical protein I3760_08G100200 [Carya illinoinensis]|uniref:Uncharacterized protein n=1 Tax=Carya illinoinensis TaxID=32201 RepID=A0A922JAY3_CARIL|nr:hypothetical protein I3760_08G100200 [Carya illinoinensis]KAG6700178.1 hypothetical protein I3842_08G099500 [Carya illinoinensis]
MFGFICSRQQLLLTYRRTQLGFIQKNAFFLVKSFTSKGLFQYEDKQQEGKPSFTVSYLINSCGLSPKSAILASKIVDLENPDRPDSVRNLLKENGFTNIQITTIVRRRPQLLLADPGKILLPKIEFFRSIGLSSSELPKIITMCPELLRRSLNQHLIPCYNFLKSVLLEDDKVITTLKRSSRAFLNSVVDNMVPNIELLREIGAPQSTISLLVTNYPDMAFIKHGRFDMALQEVREMGFDPSKSAFVLALQVILKVKKPKWESKLEVYKRWGWSKDVAFLAFKRAPQCMLVSEEKICKAMDFLVNQMGFSSEDIARNPIVILLSLKKRIIPRCSVVQILQANGFLKNDISSSTILLPNEKRFLDKYVIKFLDHAPQLMNVYRAQIELLDVEIQSAKVTTERL